MLSSPLAIMTIMTTTSPPLPHHLFMMTTFMETRNYAHDNYHYSPSSLHKVRR
jgi:hypothetical protein